MRRLSYTTCVPELRLMPSPATSSATRSLCPLAVVTLSRLQHHYVPIFPQLCVWHAPKVKYFSSGNCDHGVHRKPVTMHADALDFSRVRWFPLLQLNPQHKVPTFPNPSIPMPSLYDAETGQLYPADRGLQKRPGIRLDLLPVHL